MVVDQGKKGFFFSLYILKIIRRNTSKLKRLGRNVIRFWLA